MYNPPGQTVCFFYNGASVENYLADEIQTLIPFASSKPMTEIMVWGEERAERAKLKHAGVISVMEFESSNALHSREVA